MTWKLTTPSASLVLPWSVRLIEHCTSATKDPLLSEIATICVKQLKELLSTDSTLPNSVHMLYRIATFLTPNLWSLKMLDERVRQEVIQGVKEIIEDLKFDTHGEDVEPTPAKRPTVLSKFSDWEDNEESCGSKSLDIQIQEYRTMKLEHLSQQNILQWWNSHQSHISSCPEQPCKICPLHPGHEYTFWESIQLSVNHHQSVTFF